MGGWRALRAGLSRAVRYPWVPIVLYAVNLLSALLLAILPAALSLASGVGRRPTAIHQAADGVDPWLVLETLMIPASGVPIDWSGLQSRLQQALLLGLLTTVALPLLAWLPTAFLAGGVLLTYAEAPIPFRWRRFLWGCWHWFGTFLLLSALQTGVAIVAFGTLILLSLAAIDLAGPWLAWILVPLLALAAVLWLALTEMTRVAAVAGGTRSVARAIRQALGLVRRRFPSLAGLYGLALATLALLHGLHRWGVLPLLPLHWWPLVLIVQQVFVLGRLCLRLARTAGGVALFLAYF